MGKRKIKILALIIISFFAAQNVLAHQPRLITGQELNIITNPEVSQAFYGEMHGQPALYNITSDKPFKLYVNLLVPDIYGIKKDISALVTKLNGDYREQVFLLDGQKFEWTPYHEEFANDNYFKGPENKIDAGPGSYLIKIYNDDNQGKYVLVVGEKEGFPPMEILNSLIVLPQLKKDFFNKSYIDGFLNTFGMYVFGGIFGFLFCLWLIIFIIKKIVGLFKRNKEPKEIEQPLPPEPPQESNNEQPQDNTQEM